MALPAKNVIRMCLEALIETQSTPKFFREELRSGALERRLEILTPLVFDPHGRVRAVLAAKEWLEWCDDIEADGGGVK